MLEMKLERLLFACRWLLAPLYLGLSLALLVLVIKLFQEAIHVITSVMSLAEADLVLTVLALIDLVLVGSLIVMVMFSGYENFVSCIVGYSNRHYGKLIRCGLAVRAPSSALPGPRQSCGAASHRPA